MDHVILFFNQQGQVVGREVGGFAAHGIPPLKLDGVSYPFVDFIDVAPGIVDVPVKLDDNGKKFDTFMVVGLVGVKVSDSDSAGDITAKSNSSFSNLLPVPGKDNDHDRKKDTLQPVVGWWMCENTGVTLKILEQAQEE